MNTINNQNIENVPAFRARVQLESLRRPVQILQGDSLKDCQPVQLSHFASEFSAFRDLANGPVMDLEELDNSVNFYDSDPEILLSDSDEEEEIMEDCKSDDETVDGSDYEGELSESCDGDDVFDEPMNNALPQQHSNKVKSSNAFTVPRRIFLEDCDTAKKQ